MQAAENICLWEKAFSNSKLNEYHHWTFRTHPCSSSFYLEGTDMLTVCWLCRSRFWIWTWTTIRAVSSALIVRAWGSYCHLNFQVPDNEREETTVTVEIIVGLDLVSKSMDHGLGYPQGFSSSEAVSLDAGWSNEFSLQVIPWWPWDSS